MDSKMTANGFFVSIIIPQPIDYRNKYALFFIKYTFIKSYWYRQKDNKSFWFKKWADS